MKTTSISKTPTTVNTLLNWPNHILACRSVFISRLSLITVLSVHYLMLFAEGKWWMLQNNLIANISLSVFASVMSRMNSLACFFYGNLVKYQIWCCLDIFDQTEGLNNYLKIIHINLIICCRLRDYSYGDKGHSI